MSRCLDLAQSRSADLGHRQTIEHGLHQDLFIGGITILIVRPIVLLGGNDRFPDCRRAPLGELFAQTEQQPLGEADLPSDEPQTITCVAEKGHALLGKGLSQIERVGARAVGVGHIEPGVASHRVEQRARQIARAGRGHIALSIDADIVMVGVLDHDAHIAAGFEHLVDGGSIGPRLCGDFAAIHASAGIAIDAADLVRRGVAHALAVWRDSLPGDDSRIQVDSVIGDKGVYRANDLGRHLDQPPDCQVGQIERMIPAGRCGRIAIHIVIVAQHITFVQG